MSEPESHDDLELLLKHRYSAPPPREAFVAQLDERLRERLTGEGVRLQIPATGEASTMRPRKRAAFWSTIARNARVRLAAAAAVMVAVGLGSAAIISMLSSPRTLQAQAMEAIRKAKTIHAVGRNADMTTRYEVWYEQGVGVCETEWRNGQRTTRIDDGRYEWRYFSGTKRALRRDSVDPIGVVAEILDPDRILSRAKPDPSGDQVIAGFRCSLYVGSYPNNPDGSRLMAWLDDQKRIRLFKEKRLRDGKWETAEHTEVDYDVLVDRSVFKAEFGPDVQVIVAGDPGAMEKMYGLDSAIATREVMGLVFAVHELRRCERGFVYVVASLRPNQETIRELGPVVTRKDQPLVSYGDFQLASPWTREKMTYYGSHSYQGCRLGTWRGNGLEIQWSVLIPKGDWLETAAELELGAFIHTRGELQEKRKGAGLQWWGRENPAFTLPLPQEQSSLAKAIGEVYRALALIQPSASPSQANLQLPRERRPEPDGPGGEKGLFTDSDAVDPLRISERDYAEKARQELERRRGERR